jgi:hypothetical protein
MGLTLTLNRMGQSGRAPRTGLMTAGTAVVLVGLYAGGGFMVTARLCRAAPKGAPARGDDAGAQEQVAADGRRVPGRLRDRNSGAAPGFPLASSVGDEV